MFSVEDNSKHLKSDGPNHTTLQTDKVNISNCHNVFQFGHNWVSNFMSHYILETAVLIYVIINYTCPLQPQFIQNLHCLLPNHLLAI